MKLIVKSTEQGLLALHTEDGECLPQQLNLKIISEPNDLNRVVVEFFLFEGGDIELQAFK